MTVAKIGVGITTHNRDSVTSTTIRKWKALLPQGAVFVVVDDASDRPFPGATYRFENNVGIARAKNKCLELLEEAGVTDFFLADNDCYPTSKNWWRPYVDSPEPHLSYQFLDLLGPDKLRDIVEVYRDKQHVAYSGQRGCMLYYHKKCLDIVGGFDPIYGRALYEHGDLANRIHAAGLTTWRYADVVDSHKLWHSMDEHVEVSRTIPQEEQRSLIPLNAALHNQRRSSDYKAFVEYRSTLNPTGRDVVITTMLTKNVDPQRGFKWSPDPTMLTPWLESMEQGDWCGIILADELKKLPRGYTAASVVSVQPSKMNVYYQRWLHIYQYLRENADVRWVWCTDGTDVEVLRDPFSNMSEGRLYVGVENGTVGDPWMKENHRSKKFERLFKEYSRHPLLNAGVVGGDRTTMMEFAQAMVTIHDDNISERYWGRDTSTPDIGDMAAFNLVSYVKFGSRITHGPHITTEFKAYQDNGRAKFKHK